MNKTTLLAAAATIALVATPALSQNSVQPHSNVHVKSSKVHHHSAHHARAMRSNDRLARSGERDHNWSHRSGFGPVDAATGIAGGAVRTAGVIASDAVGTAGAIATAPFRGSYDNGYREGYGRPYGRVAYRTGYGYDDTYASMDEGFGTYNYDGTAIPGSPSFDARNGFTCRPGTLIKLNGQPTICQ